MKGLPFVITYTDPALPGKKRFVILPKTSDGPKAPTSTQLDTLAKEMHTSLILPGHGLAEYGERVDQDMVWLLENFAGYKSPSNPTIGQEWYDYNVKATKVWDGINWVLVGGTKHIASYLDYNALVRLINDMLSAPAIGVPVNIAPADNNKDVPPMITYTASAYFSRYGTPQAASQWQASLTNTFDITAVNVTKQGVGTTFIADKILPASTSYFWRVRYKDTQGAWSDWSIPTSFKTSAATINAPTVIVPANNSTGHITTLQLTSSNISVFNGTDTLASADWEITTGPNGTGTKLISRNGNPGVSFIVSPGVLTMGTVYYARVRHNGTLYGQSPWSVDSKFTTALPTIDTPTILNPTDNSTVSLTPQLVGSQFAVTGGTDTLVKSLWEIYSGSGSSTLIFTATSSSSVQLIVPSAILERSKTYSVRVKYTGAILGDSQWSQFRTFTTESLAAGIVLSNFCAGTTYMANVSDGTGGSYQRVEATNSAQCGYVAPTTYPAAGTILATHCVSVNKYNTVANGSGGSTEVLVESNSTSCGYVAPKTVSFASMKLANGTGQFSYTSLGFLKIAGGDSGQTIHVAPFNADGSWAVGATQGYKTGRFLTGPGNASNYEVFFRPLQPLLSEYFYLNSTVAFDQWLPLSSNQTLRMAGKTANINDDSNWLSSSIEVTIRNKADHSDIDSIKLTAFNNPFGHS